MKVEIAKPSSFLKPLYVPQYTMLGPGPTNCHPRVMHAMSLPMISPIHDEAYQLLDEIKEGVRYILQTKYDLTMVISTSGNGAMEAAICNLAEPGETVAIAINGMWSIRAADIAEKQGTNVIRTEKTPGDVFTLDDIEQTLKEHKPVLLYLVLGESSTGTLQPMEGVGDLCHRYNCLLVLDCVPSIAVVPVYTDEWGVDVVIGSSQKGLSCPPGLAPIAFSPRAVKKIMSRKSPGPVRYFDAITLGKYWGCFGDKERLHSTEIGPGAGPTSGRALRIGTLGYNAKPHIVEHILKVLKDALEYAKHAQKEKILK
ncbi:alanine--glyoxylate aminotransferase isoform X2 [Anabrus simplex]|uniref:alanine--glyoxylate aminotransferase isoform X2 n=1 Tax=Anabrus simplex TaxID=316456 RepID=UPI0034DDA328